MADRTRQRTVEVAFGNDRFSAIAAVGLAGIFCRQCAGYQPLSLNLYRTTASVFGKLT